MLHLPGTSETLFTSLFITLFQIAILEVNDFEKLLHLVSVGIVSHWKDGKDIPGVIERICQNQYITGNLDFFVENCSKNAIAMKH